MVLSTPIVCVSTCLFHVVPRVPPGGGAAEEKTGSVALYGQTKPALIVSIENVGTSAIIG